jgi:hypothetical protein
MGESGHPGWLDCFIKTIQYFHIKKNDTGIMHFLLFSSFTQPQSKYLLLFSFLLRSNQRTQTSTPTPKKFETIDKH